MHDESRTSTKSAENLLSPGWHAQYFQVRIALWECYSRGETFRDVLAICMPILPEVRKDPWRIYSHDGDVERNDDA